MTTCGGRWIIPPLLREFSERYPALTVKVRTLPSDLVVRRWRGAADIGIAGDAPSSEPVARQQLMVGELVGIAAVGLLSCNDGSVSRSEFARKSLLLGREGSSTPAHHRAAPGARRVPSRSDLGD